MPGKTAKSGAVKNKINVFENIINNNLIENFLKYEVM